MPLAASGIPSMASGAQICGAVSNGLPDDGEASRHTVQGYLQPASTPSQSLMSDPWQRDPWQPLPSQLMVPTLSPMDAVRFLPQPPPPTDLPSFCCADADGNMPTAVQTASVASSILSMPSSAQTFCDVVSSGLHVDSDDPRPFKQGYLESASIPSRIVMSDLWQSHPWQPSSLQLTASLLPPVDAAPPLPQPSSLADEFSIARDMASGAGTCGGVASGLQIASDVSRHSVQGYLSPASTQSECFLSVPCEAPESHSMSPPFEKGMSSSLQAPAFRLEPEHVLKPRRFSGQMHCEDAWNQRLKQSDKPTDTQCQFFDV
jgi:hypothetical protein